MKRLFRYTYLLIFAAMTAVMAACSSDEDVANGEQRADGKVPVRLRLSVAGQNGSSPTRATWSDTNATDDEMMNMWVVIAVHAEDDSNNPKQFEEGDIVFIHASIPETSSREIDDLVYLLPGKYHFYSFANIDLSWLGGEGIISYNKFANLLGSSAQVELPMYFIKGNVTTQAGITYPQPGEIYNISFGDPGYVKYHDIYISDSDQSEYDSGICTKTIEIDGNGFDPTIYDPEHYTSNGFGSKGIPMCNVQQNIEITGNNDNVNLIVIRMLAKIEVQITNSSAVDVTVESVSLSDVTTNSSDNGNNDNLKLLPKLTAGANTMNFVHKDIKPNLGDETKQDGYTHIINKTIEAGKTEKVTFYVNESAAPQNASGLFYLSLGMKYGDGEVEYHHALINQKGSTSLDDDAWDYIARNDYRVIPVILTDWQFRIEPLAFAPIAGYPAKTVGSDGLSATFSTGGPIILQPFVKKRTDSTWRDFTDKEVTFVSVSWKNSDGIDVSGTGKIFEQPLTYDTTTKCIYGVLNNNLGSGTYKTAVTVNVKLGPESDQYNYSFTCDVILQKQ